MALQQRVDALVKSEQNTHNINIKLQQTQEALRQSEQNNSNLEASIQQQKLAQKFNDSKEKKDKLDELEQFYQQFARKLKIYDPLERRIP